MKLPSRISLMRRVKRLRPLAERLGCNATTVVGTAVHLWCTRDFPAAPEISLPISTALERDPQLIAFVEILRELDFLDASYWLSSAYAVLAEDMYRKDLAMFFTPASLTRGLLNDLAAQGVDFGSQTFLDPACGGAAFLAPIALRMRAVLKDQGWPPGKVLKHIESHLFGTDKDLALCELSKQFLYMALHDDIQCSKYVPELKIHQADSLVDLATMLGRIDVVVCNPPYRKMISEELFPVRAAYEEVIEGQPNLYGLFISLCVRLLRIGGYAALVTPTSFLSGQNFSRLRQFLICDTDIEHIGMVSARVGVFIDVEQETALTVLRRRTAGKRAWATAKVSVVSTAGQYTPVGECILPNGGAVWPIPRSVQDVVLLKAAANANFSLLDYGYRVRIGSYVWNRDKRPKYDSLREVNDANAVSAMPLLWSRDISPDGVVYFDGNEMQGDAHRFVDLGDKRHTAVITMPSAVMQRVTSNDQPRRLVAAAVPLHIYAKYGGFIGENHVVILETTSSEPALEPKDLASLLATKAVDRFFRCISGATNVSAFELGQLGLPDPRKIKDQLAQGKSMEEAVNQSYGVDA